MEASSKMLENMKREETFISISNYFENMKREETFIIITNPSGSGKYGTGS